MNKILLFFLSVLLCMSRLTAQTVAVSPAVQSVDYNGTATIHVAAEGARYYANATGGLVITDQGVDKTFLVTDDPSLTVKSVSGGGEVTIALADDPDVIAGTAAVTINIPVPGSISGNTCISATGTQVYSVPARLGVRYLWQIVAGADQTRILSGENTNRVTVESTGKGNSVLRVYAYIGLLGSLCDAPFKEVEIKKIFALPNTETITGATCMDASVLGQDSIIMYGVKPYLGTYNSKSEYVWTITSGLQELYRSADGSTIFLKVRNTSADQQISVKIGGTCNGNSNILTKTLKAPAPVPTFESGSFCISDEAGTQATFSVTNNPEGKFSYRWVVPDNWEKISANGADSTQVTIQFNDSGTGNITVVASRNGCGAQFSAFGINRYPAVAPAMTGAECIPFGDTTPLTYRIQGGANTYTWEVLPSSAGWTIAPGNGPTIAITPAFGNIPASGVVEVRATIEGDCGAAPVTSTLTVKVGPDRPATISGITCIPYGTASLTYNIAAIPRATGYQWTIPATWTVTGNTNGTSITVNPNNTNGVLKVVALGCSAASTSAVTELPTTLGPATPAVISGPVCLAYGTTGMSYSIDAVANALGYQWDVPAGWSHILSTDQRSIVITATNNTPGIIRVKALGCSENAHSAFRGLPVTIGPPQPGIITGPGCITVPGNQGTYSVAPVANATGYAWSFPAGWTMQGPANAATVVVTTGSAGGVVSVRALGCDANTASASTEIPVVVAPAQPGPISYYVDGNTSDICITKGSGHTVTFSIAPVFGATSYTWTFPSAWGVSPVTTTNLSATAVTDASSDGMVTVTANSISGCNSIARTLEVVRSGLELCITAAPLSNQYKFYMIDETNIGNGTAAYYRWSKGTVVILEGRNESACAALNNSGTLRVEVTDSNGCVTIFEVSTDLPAGTTVCNDAQASALQHVGTSSRIASGDQNVLQEQLRAGNLRLFPNPVSDEINIVLPGHVQQANLLIYSVNGKQVAAVSGVMGNTILNVRNYEAGAYYVIVNSSNGMFYDKFIVSH